MAEELDEIGRETAALMRQMLQLATLVALRARERGQREAEAQVKVTDARNKDTKERILRDARESKAKDPRNLELARMLQRPAPERGVSLERDSSFAAQTSAARSESGAASGRPAQSTSTFRYDSTERRQALAQHLSQIGIAPDLAAVRMLMDVGQAHPPTDALRARAEETRRLHRAREIEARGLERSRGM